MLQETTVHSPQASTPTLARQAPRQTAPGTPRPAGPGPRAGGGTRRLRSRVSLDLRRHQRRELAQLVVQRSEHLPPGDRELLRAVYDKGLRVVDLARAAHGCPRAMRRRIRVLVARVISDRYIFVASRQDAWCETRRRVAIACVLHGLSLRRAAESLGFSLHLVRRHHDAILAQAEGVA
jgi:hypothetical protein